MSVFTRSVRVFRDNPVVAVPLLASELLLLSEGYVPHFFHISIATARAFIDPTVDKVAVCFTCALANAAWRYGRAPWPDAWRALRKHALDLTLFMWLYLLPQYGVQLATLYSGPGHAVVRPLMDIISLLLLPVIWFCFSWSATAIVTGNLRIVAACRISLSLTRRRFGKTLWLFVISIAGAIPIAVVAVRSASENHQNAFTLVLEGVVTVIACAWAAVVYIMYVGEYLRTVPDDESAIEQSRAKEEHVPLTAATEPAS